MEERIIIKGIGQQNKLIFEHVFQYYYSGLCVFCLNYIDSREIVEDIVQELFLYLWQSGKKIEINTSLKNYLFTAAKYKCLDYNRRKEVKAKYLHFSKVNKEDYEESVQNYLVETELREIIEKELQKLPPRCREIFELSRFKGKSNEEISMELNISKRTVEVQISNAIKVLKISLKDYLFILPFLF